VVNGLFTGFPAASFNCCAVEGGMTTSSAVAPQILNETGPDAAGRQTHGHPWLGGRKAVRAAEALRREFGDDAAMAAALRVVQARANDNPYSYCLWREVERLLRWMQEDEAPVAGMTRH
jgi:hypothetical protein